MRLIELDPQFLKVTAPDSWKHVDAIAEADGLIFLCPKCFEATAGQSELTL